MPQELLAALVGAAVSGALMVISNRSNRSQGNFREIFHRLSAIEKDVARLEGTRRDPNGWRKR